MAENKASGPQISQTVIYTITPGTWFVRLTTFPPSSTGVDRQSVSYDGTGTVANTWRFPDIQTGL